MFNSLRQSLGTRYAKWHFRNDGESQQVLTDFFRRAQSFLVVLPAGYEEAHTAGGSLKKLFDVLKSAHLTIVTTGTRSTALSEIQRSNVVRMGDADVNRLFLPRQNVLKRISARSYDVAIDMNLDFVLHAAYICKASRAPIRIGIVHQHGEPFFNIQVNLDRSAPLQHVYEKFVHCLEMF